VTGPHAPDAAAAADRALCLYAFTRRGAIEYALGEFGNDPRRFAQAEAARVETDRWLDANALRSALTPTETRLLEAESGAWPAPAIADAMWRREALGALLWALGHLESMPPMNVEFVQADLEEAITRSGSVESFRVAGRLRSPEQIDAAWREADAWLGATEDATGEDAALASVSAERTLALSWLRGESWPA
jgi:hypothetical protein